VLDLRLKGLLLAAGLLLLCSRSNDNVAGTTTETDSGTSARIVGLIVYADTTPVSAADVILHDQGIVKLFVLTKQAALIRSGRTETNINGFFEFDSVDTGKYLVEVNDHDTLGALLRADVKPSDTLVQVNGTLRRMGTIVGRIDTGTVDSGAVVTVYLPEIGRHAVVDSAGYFTIPDVPEWEYQMRVMEGDSVIRLPNDTVPVPVAAGDTTNIHKFGSQDATVIIHGVIIEPQ
jgi:hypothetical protein